MRRLLLPLALLLVALPGQAQDAASVTWTLTEADGLAVSSAEGVATGAAVDAGALVVRDYTGTLTGGANGPLGPYQRWWLDNAEWPVESAPDAGRYVEFAVSAPEGGTFNVTDVSLVMNAGGTGELDASLFYSTDPSFSAPTPLATGIDLSRDAVGTFNYDDLDVTLTGGQTLYLRVYPWLGGGNASATRYLFLQNVTIAGTGTAPEPEPVEGVNWALTEADTTSVTASGEGVGGAPARGSTLEVRDYTGDLRDAGDAVGPLGPFQRWWLGGAEWPVEGGPDADRYVEFAAGAEDGLTFYVDGVSLYVHGDGTSEMTASVYYSTSPTFADSVALEESFAAGDGDFGGPTLREYSLDVAVPSGDSIYVRVYPWVGGGNPSTGRYLLLQDMTISGTTEAPPEVNGILWTLSADDTTSVSAAVPNIGGSMARGSNLEVRDYDGDLRDAGDAVGPFGPFQRWWIGEGVEWPVESAIDADRYVEFAVGPDDGFAFRADSLSVYVHGDGTSEMRASLFYSTEADFSDPVALEENFRAGDGDFGGPTLRTYSLDAAVLPGDSVYVRVYPYLGGGNPSVTRFLLLQAMTIYGEAVDPATVSNEDGPAAGRLTLHPSAPNPTATSTTLRFELAEAAEVEVVVVNVLGQRVATLASGPAAAGPHAVTVDASGLAAGTYFVQVRAGGEAQTRRFTVVR